MRLHEVLEQAAAALFMFRDVLLQCRDRHGADVADCEHRGELDAQGEPFDVAVEFAREQERGLQCRVHEIMLLDRNENGLETHGDLLAISHSCARRRPWTQVGEALRRLAVSRTTPRRAIGTPVALFYHANGPASSIGISQITAPARSPFAAPLRSQGAEKPATAARSRAGLRTAG